MDTEEYHIGTSESALFLCQEKQRKRELVLQSQSCLNWKAGILETSM